MRWGRNTRTRALFAGFMGLWLPMSILIGYSQYMTSRPPTETDTNKMSTDYTHAVYDRPMQSADQPIALTWPDNAVVYHLPTNQAGGATADPLRALLPITTTSYTLYTGGAASLRYIVTTPDAQTF